MRAIGIILAGGNNNRMRELSNKRAIAAMPIAGSYRSIDFALSNMASSHIQRVAVLTQYNARSLNEHLSSSKWWDFGRKQGGLFVFTPTITKENSLWYQGTADALYQNIDFLKKSHEPYVIIATGDGVYKMDYGKVLEAHIAKNADITVVYTTLKDTDDDLTRFGVLKLDENERITEFEEKPEHPRSNLASMGIYIFSWKALKESLTALKDQPSCDFGKHILPYCRDNGKRLFAYEFNGYWKDVGTLGSYWEANMELIDIIPEFNLYEEFWKIYTKGDIIRPQYVSGDAVIDRCIIGEGAEIYGEVHNSVIGADVRIEKGVVVRDSIIMRHSTIGEGTQVNKAIIAENVHVGKHVVMGVGEEAPNVLKPNIYGFGLVTVGEKAVIPDGVTIGKNVCISGETSLEDYPDGTLPSGGAIVEKDGE